METTPIIDELLESECRSAGHANQSWVREHQARNIERAFHHLERLQSASTLKDEADRLAKTTADSADAQCFRWLLTHHGGSDGKRCWIGGVGFLGQNLRVSIIDAIDREDGAPYVEEKS